MPDVVALPETRYAELVAPAISRVFVSGMRPDRRLRRILRDHAGAAAGMTAAEVQAQPWGAAWSDQRRQVERRTNELAGLPFGALDAAQRLQLLADLAALP